MVVVFYMYFNFLYAFIMPLLCLCYAVDPEAVF
jgi:hypothetical protein